jgi:hypothetical protein
LSPFWQETTGWCKHVTLQFSAEPSCVSIVQSLKSSQIAGHVNGGSQVSPFSTSPLPQVAEQSSSVLDEQPLAQQPSRSPHSTIGVWTQVTLQLVGLPRRLSSVQLLESLQVVGHSLGGSQVSPNSIDPLPQLSEQSLSSELVQELGQQPSPPTQEPIP